MGVHFKPGPFVIERKVNDVGYVIRTPGHRKTNRLCHINMLKAYHARESVTLMTTAFTRTGRLDGDTEGVGAAEIVENSPKLQNSDILSNIDEKLAHLLEMEREQIKSLITEFSSIFPDTLQVAYHDVDVGQAQPVKQHPYKVNPVKRKVIREEVKCMLDNGLIEPSTSKWSSPCVLVPKPDGSHRFCTDFRRVNVVTKTYSHPIPRINNCIDRMGHTRYISKFDLLKGYWQVPLTERAKEVSVFVTPDGLYHYCVIPFGMKNPPATFQRMINGVIAGLKGGDAY